MSNHNPFEWQVISEKHESGVMGYWMVVHNAHVIWRGLSTDGMDIAYAIVSFHQSTENIKVLMPDRYNETRIRLREWRDSGRLPQLPYITLEKLDNENKEHISTS